MDDAWFHLNGYINSQKSRIWSAETPPAQHENTLHSSKIGIRCVVSRKRFAGPLFFEQTIAAENYQNLLTQFIPLLEQNERDCWFRQDGTTAHIAHIKTAFLQDFCDRIAGRGLRPP
ncbi:hypothetical protein Cfor_01564 [Coptotermes formosanus]|uniref:Tc1-like transposase DDE domain-containing protein n=1 Tax=Coptotermes formosanus TaxID=36987 RepID=A0A6L2PGR7_COPFO|nr:hypothetical protein Cfor_01564 [Coptotermes formosanus]